MEFLVLGPLEVRRGGEAIEVRGSKRRALLVLLILHANEVVRTDRLVDELWGEQPPANAQAALQSHVSRLRRDLGADVLATKPWGYVLRAESTTIDLRLFESLVSDARTLAAEERRAKLEEALMLWRGPALADVANEPALVTEVARLEELHVAALEQRIDADLELGGNPGLVHELEVLVAEHPLRERLRGQLILALYRAGRQAEALETYRETRRVLVEELGIEPSPELRELERAILRQDPSLVVGPPTPASVDAEALTDRSLWRWPRSPLAVAASVLLLAGAGAAAAILISSGAPADGTTAAPVSPLVAPSSTTETTQPITTTTSRKQPRKRPVVHRPVSPPPPAAPPLAAQTTQTTEVTQTIVREPAPPPSPPSTTVRTNSPPATTTTTEAQQPWDYMLTDNFRNPALDYGMWSLSSNDGVTAIERNGRLELSVDAGATAPDGSNGFGTHYGTQCSFVGDFDARVEYALLTWPAKNGINVFLSPWFQGAPYPTFVGRTGQSATAAGYGAEMYTTGLRDRGRGVQTADTSGALRVRRLKGNISTYYSYRGEWVELGSRYERGVVLLLIGLNANTGEFGQQPAAVAFDNFRATAPEGSIECTGVPYPQRKPRSQIAPP